LEQENQWICIGWLPTQMFRACDAGTRKQVKMCLSSPQQRLRVCKVRKRKAAKLYVARHNRGPKCAQWQREKRYICAEWLSACHSRGREFVQRERDKMATTEARSVQSRDEKSDASSASRLATIEARVRRVGDRKEVTICGVASHSRGSECVQLEREKN
jgi:hypothetical protein